MKVRLIRDWLTHRSGDVLSLGVGDARRLLNVRVATPYVEADSPPTEQPMQEEEKVVETTKEIVPPVDKMVRSSNSKTAKNKKKKKRGRPRKT